FDAPPMSSTTEAPHRLGARHELVLDELHHLVWSNSIDRRDPEAPRWSLVDRAVGIGATPGGAADVILPDGTPSWLDGGPPGVHEPVDGVPVLHAVTLEHGSLAVPRTVTSSADLAADQMAAVTHRGGSARIVAPAGSGKTRALTERARHLVGGWNVPPSAIGLVAFNKRAQEEMRERTADLPGVQVRTLNSIALAVLNGTPPFAPRPGTVRTIDEPEVRRILGGLVSFPRRRNTDPVAPWIEALGLIRLGLVDPEEAEARYDGDVDGLRDVWPRYREALARAGAVDFDGQIHGAVEVLLSDPVARAAAQHVCRHLLVDEFQDLTPAHLLLIRLLAGPAGAVFGVGDDDQTIYGYNGADPAWLIDFAELFPGAGTHPLEINYRCPAGLVVAADRLLRHNRRRVPKTIRAARAPAAAGEPDGWTVVTSDDPVGDTVRRVVDVVAAGRTAAEVAVLARVNAVLAPPQVALTIAGIPISGGVGLEFLERTSVRAALAWLRLATAGPAGLAATDLAEAQRRPSRSIHPRIADWVTEQRDVEQLRRLAARLNNDRDTERVAELADDIEMLQQAVAAGSHSDELFRMVADDIGLAGAVATLDTTRHGMNRSAQGDDLGALRQIAVLQPDPRLLEEWLRRHLAVRRDPAGVVLATVHRVKGQEWPEVVVHLVDADQYPHRLADDLEEERRLFHVAVTRASEHATVVTGPRPSPFVAELSSEPPVHPPPGADVDSSRSAPARSASGRERSGGSRTRPGRRPDTEDHPLLDREAVVVAPGLVLVDQGTEWMVETVGGDEILTRSAAGATRRFPLDRAVQTAGRQRGRPRPADEHAPPPAALAFDELRRFRDGARDGKPAYTVFDDKTLAAIAVAAPATLDELARVRGVGPAKLEQYGADVLAVVAAAASPTDAADAAASSGSSVES
ncbi:MAG: UvrD-helicase domain-containing protein, partial [Ilumatobacteraceae bacterium]